MGVTEVKLKTNHDEKLYWKFQWLQAFFDTFYNTMNEMQNTRARLIANILQIITSIFSIRAFKWNIYEFVIID